jgi:hypothetical protein
VLFHRTMDRTWPIAVVVVAGCYAPDPQAGAPCPDGRCPSGQLCLETPDGPQCLSEPPGDRPDAPPGEPPDDDAPAVCATILAGGVDPAVQGWQIVRDGDGEIATAAGTTRLDTSSPAGSNKRLLLRKDAVTDPAGFALEFVARVIAADAPHEPAQAGLALLGTFSNDASDVDRSQMVFFEPGRIGWGDDSQTFATTTTVRRTYRLEVAGGTAQVLVDGVLALTRSNYRQTNGSIAIGDTDLATDQDCVVEIESVVACR